MQTHFTKTQLEDPGVARSNEILRSCVHCGFCTATCPTYQVLGDELDSPRGRIYQIKEMLENEQVPDAKTVKHVDRCLSCLACMTTCPSGVHYMHLVDHARSYIEKNYRRRLDDRILRWLLAKTLPYPGRFRLAMRMAKLARPFRALVPDRRLRAMLNMASARIVSEQEHDKPQVFPAVGEQRMRVALMTGCAQKVLNDNINAATIRLLTRHGCEVVIANGAACCGALTHHMGKEADSHTAAANNINAWMREVDEAGLDAIVINTSGCGTTVKDYGHMFRNSGLSEKAAKVASLAADVSEVLSQLELTGDLHKPLRVAYHSACSLQHGQQIKSAPKNLLKAVGFEVVEPPEGHLCCGSAGTYNLLQPEISQKLLERKASNIKRTKPQVIAAGNIGCMMQIGTAVDTPIVHTVELLDWATGGPKPSKLD